MLVDRFGFIWLDLHSNAQSYLDVHVNIYSEMHVYIYRFGVYTLDS